jgi:hypothetical protein
MVGADIVGLRLSMEEVVVERSAQVTVTPVSGDCEAGSAPRM